jgi:hypothetical protein
MEFRVEASDGMGFGDKARAYALWRTHLPTSSPEDWRPYIDLDGEEREYNISVLIAEDRAWQAEEEAKENGEAPPRQRVWPTRRSDRPGETLYRDWGDRLEDDRWILAFSGRDGLRDLQLDPEAAAYWLCQINSYLLPPGLRHIRPRADEAAYPRLRPASRASTPSDDDRTAPGAAIRSTEGVRTDPDPTPTAGGDIEPAPTGTPEKEPAAAGPSGIPPGNRQAAGADASGTQHEAPDDHPDLVTLAQAANMAHRSKRTLERYKTAGKLPAPTVEGGGGRADMYDWKVMRTWLEAEFGVKQPEAFPARRRYP